MFSRSISILSVFCIVIVSAGLPVSAEDKETRSQFDRLFAEDIKNVQSSKSTDDDLNLASRMMEYLKDKGLSKAFKRLLCEKVIDLVKGDLEGDLLSSKAMNWLGNHGGMTTYEIRLLQVQLAEAKAEALSPQLREVLTPQIYARLILLAQAYESEKLFRDALKTYTRANALARKISKQEVAEVAAARSQMRIKQQTQIRLDGLKKKIITNPNKELGIEAASIILLHMNKVTEARMYVEAAGEKEWTEMLSLMADKKPEALSDEDLKKLLHWWRPLIAKVPDYAKYDLYGRVIALSTEYLSRKSVKGVERLEFDRLTHKLEEEHQKLEIAKEWIEKMAALSPGTSEGKIVTVDLMTEAMKLRKTAIGNYQNWDVKDGVLIHPKGDDSGTAFFFDFTPQGHFVIEGTVLFYDKNSGLKWGIPFEGRRRLYLAIGRKEIDFTPRYEDIFIKLPRSKRPITFAIHIKELLGKCEIKMFINGKLVKQQVSNIADMYVVPETTINGDRFWMNTMRSSSNVAISRMVYQGVANKK